MDAKGRLAMPAKHRERLMAACNGQLVATIDTQSRCLAIYPLPAWEDLEEAIQGLPSMDPAVRRFKRLVIGYASDIELDKNGRMLLPPALREYAELEKKLVLVGQTNKLELWSEELWRQEEAKLLEDAEADLVLPEQMMSLPL
jgi:MraZ protein